MKGHFLNCELKLEHNGKVVKKKIGKLGGEVEYTLPNRKKVVLPFKSFVKTFLDEVRNISVSNSGGVKKIVTGIAGTAGAASYGILVGASSVDPLTTAVYTRVSDSKVRGASYNYSAMTMPTTVAEVTSAEKDTVTYYFDMSRTLTNNANTNVVINEVYLAGVNSTATGGLTVYAIDKYKNIAQSTQTQSDSLAITPGSVVSVTFRFQMSRPYSTGGALSNLARMLFNVLMANSIEATALTRYNGTSNENTYADYAIGGAGTTTSFHGIVVGYLRDRSTLNEYIPANPNLYNETFVAHTGLTLAANTVGTVVQTGDNGAQFTITRTITNTSTVSKTITHIGLFANGGSNSTSAIANDAIPYAFNKIEPIVLAPNQTLNVTYTFSVEI